MRLSYAVGAMLISTMAMLMTGCGGEGTSNGQSPESTLPRSTVAAPAVTSTTAGVPVSPVSPADGGRSETANEPTAPPFVPAPADPGSP